MVGFLNGGGQAAAPIFEGFKVGMTELGYVEGETIVYESHTFDPDQTEQLAAIAQALVDQSVDLILAGGSFQAALTAKQVTQNKDIPVIFVGTNDPVGIGC